MPINRLLDEVQTMPRYTGEGFVGRLNKVRESALRAAEEAQVRIRKTTMYAQNSALSPESFQPELQSARTQLHTAAIALRKIEKLG